MYIVINMGSCIRWVYLISFFIVNISGLKGQTFFSEAFNSPSISTNLLIPPEYTLNNGLIGSFGGRPPFYVRTVGTSYNNIDFRAGITIHLNNQADGNGIAYFGIGSGVGDPNWANEPTYSGFGYLIPSAWGGEVSKSKALISHLNLPKK